jgi:hypothetical protein
MTDDLGEAMRSAIALIELPLEETDEELQNLEALLDAGGNPGAVIVMLVSLFQDLAAVHPDTARQILDRRRADSFDL